MLGGEAMCEEGSCSSSGEALATDEIEESTIIAVDDDKGGSAVKDFEEVGFASKVQPK